MVDTSALMAIVLGEPGAENCMAVIEAADNVLISAVTLSETLIVAAGRMKRTRMTELIDGIAPDIADVTAATSVRVADAYRRWGKGFHRASLNFGDCFAYALAQERNCPLLFVGEDFSQTDAVAAAPAG